MTILGNVCRRLNHIAPVLLLGAGLLALCGCSRAPESSASSSTKPEFLFVQTADDLAIDPATNTMRLVKVGQQTLYFTDRPVRQAGHIKMAAFLEEWTTKAGKDNFAADPSNATLLVYEPGQADNTLAVVESSQPRVEGADLVYRYKLLEGKLPASGGGPRCSSTGLARVAASVPGTTESAPALAVRACAERGPRTARTPARRSPDRRSTSHTKE